MAKPIDRRVEIGRVTLGVADLERAIAFYQAALGFDVVERAGRAAWLGAGAKHHHIRLEARAAGAAAADGRPVAIRYPDRASLGDAVRRLQQAGVAIQGAADDGVSETVALCDPDGHRLELYRERPRTEWPREADGTVRAVPVPCDLQALAAVERPGPAPVPAYAPMTEKMRQSLRELRTRLLQLHKVLLDDARAAYEMDRGRVGSSASLLQLVINDPWFAWLHSLSELVVRIDESVEPESPATDADAAALTDQVDRLLTASEDAEGFQRRYYEALQRQPAVVLAHADVKRALKASR